VGASGAGKPEPTIHSGCRYTAVTVDGCSPVTLDTTRSTGAAVNTWKFWLFWEYPRVSPEAATGVLSDVGGTRHSTADSDGGSGDVMTVGGDGGVARTDSHENVARAGDTVRAPIPSVYACGSGSGTATATGVGDHTPHTSVTCTLADVAVTLNTTLADVALTHVRHGSDW
jgi:hypothetical protein